MMFKRSPRASSVSSPASEESEQGRLLAEAETRLATGRLGARCIVLATGEEFACIARNITMMQAEIRVYRSLAPDAAIVLHLDVLGLVQGRVLREVAGGYVVLLQVAQSRRAEFAARLGKAEMAASAPDERVAPRIVPNLRETAITMPGGTKIGGARSSTSRRAASRSD